MTLGFKKLLTLFSKRVVLFDELKRMTDFQLFSKIYALELTTPNSSDLKWYKAETVTRKKPDIFKNAVKSAKQIKKLS